MVLEDLGEYLQRLGLGILAQTLFLGGIPLDTPQGVQVDEVAALVETPGFPAGYVHDVRGPSQEYPVMQILVRGKPHDYAAPRRRAQEMLGALGTITNQVLSGTFYLWVRPWQTVFPLYSDDLARRVLSAQVRIAKDTEEGMALPLGLRKYVLDFTNLATILLPGTVHQLGTADLVIELYNNASPRQRIPNIPSSVHPTTFDVTVTLIQPMSGRLVVIG